MPAHVEGLPLSAPAEHLKQAAAHFFLFLRALIPLQKGHPFHDESERRAFRAQFEHERLTSRFPRG